MIIGIEAERANLADKTGVEHYAKQLILHFAEFDRQNQYVLYLRTPPQQWLLELPANFHLKVLPFPLFWTQLRLSWELWRHPVDALLIPASALPLVHPVNSVVVVHDTAWKYFSESFTWFMRNFLEWSTRFAVKRAARVIAVSASTKQDLLKFYGADPEKIAVVHHGYQLSGAAFGGAKEPREPLLPQRYILFLSTLQPRKNLIGLISAFRQLKRERPELPHRLVVVGKPGWKYEEILRTIEQNRDIVVYLNHVSEPRKAQILAKAEALVLPSFYEGFGMQVLEAFAAGVPVAVSNVSSLPEVAGDGAVYFDPRDAAQIKQAIQNILLDKGLADRLRENGRRRLAEFSWEKCAKQTLAVLSGIQQD
ncbi:MAG: glycosyltransferase family 4 protein [Patescibacteria group bacterium]|nr:glycosyltransferase family 4 protein [Patescibacteria group bacterium]